MDPSPDEVDWGGCEEATNESEVFGAFAAARESRSRRESTSTRSMDSNERNPNSTKDQLTNTNTPASTTEHIAPNTPSTNEFSEFVSASSSEEYLSSTSPAATPNRTNHQRDDSVQPTLLPIAVPSPSPGEIGLTPAVHQDSSSQPGFGSPPMHQQPVLRKESDESSPDLAHAAGSAASTASSVSGDIATPAIMHSDSQSLPSFFSPPVHQHPLPSAIAFPSGTPPALATTTPAASHPSHPMPPAIASTTFASFIPPLHSVTTGLHVPMSLTASLPATPASAVPSRSSSTVSGAARVASAASDVSETAQGVVDIPLHYAAQYSPSAASRRLSGGGTGGVTLQPLRTRSASPQIGQPASAPETPAAQQVSLVAGSPMVNQQRGSFLSNLFGWGGSSASSSAATTSGSGSSRSLSVSLPATPMGSHDAHQSGAELQYPSSSTNHARSGSSSTMAKSSSGGLSNARQQSSQHHSSTLTSSASQPSGLTRVAMQKGEKHPLHVWTIQPLTQGQFKPLLAYSLRLKSALRTHESKISKLQSQKKRFQLSRNEETTMWTKFGVSSLVSIAAGFYHTCLLKCSTELQKEFSFTAELSGHANQVQLVLEGKGSLEKLLSDLSDMQEKYVRELEGQVAMLIATQASSSVVGGGGGASATSVPPKQKELLERKQKELREMKKKHSSSGGRTSAGSTPNAASPASTPKSSSSSSPLSFLSAYEIDHIFLSPIESSVLDEQISSLQETAVKLELTYAQMQRKALAKSEDTKQTRVYRLHSILIKSGLENLEDQDEVLVKEENIFYLRSDSEQVKTAQLAFQAFLSDQRTEEGKLLARWLDQMHAFARTTTASGGAGSANNVGSASNPSSAAAVTPTSAATLTGSSLASATNPTGNHIPMKGGKITPELILGFIEFLTGEIMKRYDLNQLDREREKAHQERVTIMQQQQQHHTDSNVGATSSEGTEGENSSHHTEHNPSHPPPYQSIYSCLYLFLSRLVFSKLGPTNSSGGSDNDHGNGNESISILRSLSSEQESDLDQWYLKKVSWISLLTREQIGLNKFFLPVEGCDLNGVHKWDWSKDTGVDSHNGGLEDGDLDGSNDNSSSSDDDDDDDESGPEGVVSAVSTSTSRPTLPPYLPAMRLLHRLNDSCENNAPIDLLYLVIQCIRVVTKLANKYLEQHRRAERKAQARSNVPIPMPAHAESLHADNMFPLVLYVVLHSSLREPHFILGSLTRFLPSDTRNFGTAGYGLAMVESAVRHICDMARQDVLPIGTASPKKRTVGKLEGTPPLLSPVRSASNSLPLPPPSLGGGDCSFTSPTRGSSSFIASAPPSLPPSNVASPAAGVAGQSIASDNSIHPPPSSELAADVDCSLGTPPRTPSPHLPDSVGSSPLSASAATSATLSGQ